MAIPDQTSVPSQTPPNKMSYFTVLFLCLTYALTNGQITDNSFKYIRKIYDQCSSKEELFKCLKVQALKAADRALHLKTFNIIEGVTLVSDRTGKTLQTPPLNDTKLDQLNPEELDGLLVDRTSRFLSGHRLEVKIPKLVEEARKKKGGGGGHGALLWALAIKGSFLAMAYQGIAVMFGTALIVGKMALLLAAILGLKKLVSHEGHEKTTFEIVKVPKYSESHSHSYEEEGPYHRSLDLEDKFGLKTNPYRSYYPKA